VHEYFPSSEERNSKSIYSTFPVFGVNPIPYYIFLLPKTKVIAFFVPRAAVQGNLLKYEIGEAPCMGLLIFSPLQGCWSKGIDLLENLNPPK
jgi:hypothetical protein